MQLATISQHPVSSIAAPSLATAVQPLEEQPPKPGTGVGLFPAPANAPIAFAGASDGALRLFAPTVDSPPLVDFPGIATGDRFAIVKGSKVGFLGVKGDAQITHFAPDAATFAVRAGAFGVKVDVVVAVVQTGPDTVRISSRGTGIPDTSAEGRIVERRTNYVEFARISDPTERTIIRHDGKGGIVIDTVVPTFGAAHLVLEKQA